MNWNEMLHGLAPNGVVLLSTATTGLRPSEDELLAVALKVMASDETSKDRLLIRMLDKERVEATQEFHGISLDRMRLDGMVDRVFREQLSELLDGKLVLTYNLPFQAGFLDGWCDTTPLVSLPLLTAAADMHRVLDERVTKSLADLVVWCGKAYGKDPTFKSMCRAYGYDAMDRGVLTAPEFSVALLYRMWNRLLSVPAIVQAEMF